jgi:mono/diheme cytochrome c family protein
MLVMGVAVALALVEYGSAAAVTKVAQTRVVAAAAKKQETKAQKLAKALKACKKDKSKSKRKACEKAAKNKYKTQPNKTGTGTTGTGTTGAATTGAATTGAATTGAATTGAATTGAATTGAATTGTTTGGETPAQELARAARVNLMPTAGAIEQGRTLFAQDCSGCHGAKGEGQSGDDFVAYAVLPRAQTLHGVIEQLIEPDGGMPTFDSLPFEVKEQLGAFVCVVLTGKCEEAH